MPNNKSSQHSALMSEISYLVCLDLTGRLSPEQQVRLARWRQESPENEAAYQHLHQQGLIDHEWRLRQLAHYERPLADFKARIRQTENNDAVRSEQTENDFSTAQPILNSQFSILNSRTRRWAAAAAIAIALIGGGTWLWNHYQMDATQNGQLAQTELPAAQGLLRPGHAQATLTLDDGTQLALDSTQQGSTQQLAQANRQTAKAFAKLTTPRGGEFRVTLEDGTEVWLNAESRLSYPQTFDAEERRVALTGEAYFKVAHDQQRPFYVESGGQEVKVYGTEFNVHAYPDEQLVYTTLVTGSVGLRSAEQGGGEVMLKPNHQAVYSRDEGTAQVRQVDAEMVASWHTGTFVFENQTLDQVMKTLSRWYDFDYQFADRQLARVELMGSMPRYSTFQEVADVLEKIGGISLTMKNGKVVVGRR